MHIHGDIKQQPDSICYVSFWYIPNGSDYDQAYVVKRYFSDVGFANKFASKYSNPPEMAMVIMI